jgi:hypothetical protein
MPPTGREFGADEMTVKVDLVPISDGDEGMRKLVHDRACEIGRGYRDDACSDVFPLFAHPDVHAVYQSGFIEKSIRTYLLKSLIDAKHRPAIEAIVNRFAWTFVRLTMSDQGSEIIGDDLIILRSCCDEDQPAVVVHIAYHAG